MRRDHTPSPTTVGQRRGGVARSPWTGAATADTPPEPSQQVSVNYRCGRFHWLDGPRWGNDEVCDIPFDVGRADITLGGRSALPRSVNVLSQRPLRQHLARIEAPVDDSDPYGLDLQLALYVCYE